MRQLIAILIVVFTSMLAGGAVPRWESVDVPGNIFAEQRIDSETVEVAVRDSVIYVMTQKPVSVKVFTILGQLVTQDNLPAGVHRLPMKTKGIYILKIGTATRRVTI